MARTKIEEFTLKEIRAMDEVDHHVSAIKDIAARMADPKLGDSMRMSAIHSLLGAPDNDSELMELISMLYLVYNRRR